LSLREVEVLRLLAIGRSNRGIADTLCISLSTVATHVRNILSKTGSANRTEAAPYALRQRQESRATRVERAAGLTSPAHSLAAHDHGGRASVDPCGASHVLPGKRVV
jgi:DNA-binding CsgD family transcriptional regulator